ncbi:hypothetical protein V1281_006948 [Nitrobacteraceae bacterium AZCC 2161]
MMLITMLVTTIERRDVTLPLTWRRDHETETHEVDVEYCRLETSGVRTSIRKRQRYGYGGFEWQLAVEFCTETCTRPESWYGYRRINNKLYVGADDALTLAEFESIERELQAVIAGRVQD